MSDKTRKPISKRVRFEVFKRDSFKCQYCGATAPEVVLHVDHIKALANGGTDDITNLVTSCDSCNLGKGARPLDQNSAVAKSRAQSEALQERREQLEMMMEWQRGLVSIEAQAVNEISAFWKSLVPEYGLSESGKLVVRKWLKKLSIPEILTGMRESVACYLVTEGDGKNTKESAEQAFSKVPGICIVKRREKDEPNLSELYYIRGILRNRLSGRYYDHNKALRWLQAADSWGISIPEIRTVVLDCYSWSEFQRSISELIDNAKNPGGER